MKKTPHALRYMLAKAGHAALRSETLPGRRNRHRPWRILLFHDIALEQMERFEHLLQYLLKTHKVLDPQGVRAYAAGEQRVSDSGTAYLLTFDDGFSGQRQVAREILDAHGVKAIFFVCPGLIDADGRDHRRLIALHLFEGAVSPDDLPAHAGFMTWQDLEALAAAGHAIGSHTLTHRRVSTLGPSDLRSEIDGAAERLTSRLGVAPEWFAYPLGNLVSINQSAMAAIGYRHRFCCSGIRGANDSATPCLGLLREVVDLNWPFDLQRLVLEGGLDFQYLLQKRRLHALSRPGRAGPAVDLRRGEMV